MKIKVNQNLKEKDAFYTSWLKKGGVTKKGVKKVTLEYMLSVGIS